MENKYKLIFFQLFTTSPSPFPQYTSNLTKMESGNLHIHNNNNYNNNYDIFKAAEGNLYNNQNNGVQKEQILQVVGRHENLLLINFNCVKNIMISLGMEGASNIQPACPDTSKLSQNVDVPNSNVDSPSTNPNPNNNNNNIDNNFVNDNNNNQNNPLSRSCGECRNDYKDNTNNILRKSAEVICADSNDSMDIIGDDKNKNNSTSTHNNVVEIPSVTINDPMVIEPKIKVHLDSAINCSSKDSSRNGKKFIMENLIGLFTNLHPEFNLVELNKKSLRKDDIIFIPIVVKDKKLPEKLIKDRLLNLNSPQEYRIILVYLLRVEKLPFIGFKSKARHYTTFGSLLYQFPKKTRQIIPPENDDLFKCNLTLLGSLN